MREYKIAAIPGDGIGPEVIAAGLEVLAALAEQDGGFRLNVTHFDWGSDYYKKNGESMVHYIAVNGRTGEVMGSVPVSKPRLLAAALTAGTVLEGFVIAFLGLTR